MKKLLRALTDYPVFLLIWLPSWWMCRTLIPGVRLGSDARFELIQSIFLEFMAERGIREWPGISILICDLSWEVQEIYYCGNIFGKKFAMLALYFPADATRDEIKRKLHPAFGPKDEGTSAAASFGDIVVRSSSEFHTP